jgi:antitoxin (DNA-binding transcriptional repressor) of toxin-antitoxin stability system
MGRHAASWRLRPCRCQLTSYGHTVTMERVTVAQLKSRLSYYLREVRAGRSFTVVSRDIPVATLVPHDAVDDGLLSIPADPSAPSLSAPVIDRAADAPDAVELIRRGREDSMDGPGVSGGGAGGDRDQNVDPGAEQGTDRADRSDDAG